MCSDCSLALVCTKGIGDTTLNTYVLGLAISIRDRGYDIESFLFDLLL